MFELTEQFADLPVVVLGELPRFHAALLGATRVPDAQEDNKFRVFRDPAGHTFCLIW